MSEHKHDLDNEWKLPMIILIGVTVSVGAVGLITIFSAMP